MTYAEIIHHLDTNGGAVFIPASEEQRKAYEAKLAHQHGGTALINLRLAQDKITWALAQRLLYWARVRRKLKRSKRR